MQICFDIDPETVRSYSQRGSSPAFVIYWEHEGTVFPDRYWSERGLVLLSWWLSVATSLVNGGGEAAFQFMEADIALIAIARGSDVHITTRAYDVDWHVSLTELSEALIDAAFAVSERMRLLDSRDADGFGPLIEDLRHALQNNAVL